jgi:hypothetical protein
VENFRESSTARVNAITESCVTFTWKDYSDGSRIKHMTLSPAEFIRRFLLHVLPDGFQRIRRYGFAMIFNFIINNTLGAVWNYATTSLLTWRAC